MKKQIYFYMQKNFRYVFNENTDNFFHAKNHRSIFNKNTDMFLYACERPELGVLSKMIFRHFKAPLF